MTIVSAQLLMAAWGAYRLGRRPMLRRAKEESFVVEPPVPVHAVSR
jgi:hypothetical protein